MLEKHQIENIFFLGIGGIGMSALARYFHAQGTEVESRKSKVERQGTEVESRKSKDKAKINRKTDDHPVRVCGYDRTPSALTRQLEEEGIQITFADAPDMLLSLGLSARNTLVVRTPAVPEDSVLYTWLREQGFDIRKRSEVLGLVTRTKKALCVAGTHGKTTTSTMLAHLMAGVGVGVGFGSDAGDGVGNGVGVNAFLGGISMNYGTNVLIDKESDYVVVEADEYDRSFHRLTPYMSIITAVDPDHLDIYGTAEAYREAFEQYTELITGALVIKHGLPITPRLKDGVRLYTYGLGVGIGVGFGDAGTGDGDAGTGLGFGVGVGIGIGGHPDFYAERIRVGQGTIVFDYHTPEEVITDIRLGVPVWVNIENAVAAMAVAYLIKRYELRLSSEETAAQLRQAMGSFRGVLRRFNIHVQNEKVVYIDDYAHHPDEIATSIHSVRKLYPDHRLIGVFQPHLYTRTRDFADGFARVLATLDECILLPIYPARELPIPGVTSGMLAERIQPQTKVSVVEKADLVATVKDRLASASTPVVVMTIGAGDIDRLVEPMTEALK